MSEAREPVQDSTMQEQVAEPILENRSEPALAEAGESEEKPEKKDKMSNRKRRTITSLILIPILFLLLYLRSWYMGAVIVAATVLSIHEEFRAFRVGGYRPVTIPTWVVSIGYLPLQLLFPARNWLVPVLCVMFFWQTLILLCRKEPRLPDLLVSNLPLFTLAVPGMCCISFLGIEDVGLQILFLVGATMIAVVCDIAAYEAGTRFGKHKFFSHVSPKKTVEGALGGLLGGMLTMVLIGIVVNLSFGQQYSTVLGYVLIGLGGAMVSEVGDLFASLIKRHCNIKDFGTLFPGHGGMLDRMDSIFFTAIYMYCIKILFF